ncbi:hypothetical protein EMMF5_000892 [Cystobasidiomycetes sp. EMM_F5]
MAATAYDIFPDDECERSYGIIPLRFGQNDSFIEVLTIQHLSTGEFGFPKGHAEKTDASPIAAGLRELKEETGLTPISLITMSRSSYFESRYTNPRNGRNKVVVVWPAEVTASDKEVNIQPEEIMSFRFVDIRQAHTVLSWKEDKLIVEKLIIALENGVTRVSVVESGQDHVIDV